MNQTQELTHGVDHADALQLLVVDRVTERSEVDFCALQKLAHGNHLLLRTESVSLSRPSRIPWRV